MKNGRLVWQIVTTVVVVFIIALASVNYWAKWRAQHEIEKLSGRKLNDMYVLQVGKSYLNIWNGELVAAEVTLETDTVAWKALHAQYPDSFPPLLSVSLQAVQIRNFNWIHYFTSHHASLRNLVVESPVIKMVSYRDTLDKKSLKDQLAGLPDLIAPFADILKIKKVSVNNADITLQTIKEKGDTVTQVIGKADLFFKDVNIDPESDEITFCSEMEVSAGHFETIFNSATQKIEFDDFKFSKKGRQVSLHNFAVVPQRTEQQFFKDIGVRRAYFNIKCAEILAHGFDLDRFIGFNYMHIDSLRIQEPVANFTVNQLLPLPYRKLLPHELIRNIRSSFNIEKVIVKNADIIVTTRVPGRDFAITFDRSYITAINCTNDTLLMNAAHPMEIWAESQLLNQSPVKLKLNVPLLSPTFDADYTASVHALPLEALNPVINHKRVSIKSGYMRSVDISSAIRNGVATGKVVMQYHDLQLEIMKKDTGKTRKFASKIANILLNEDNEKEDPSSFITGEINLTRNRQEEFFAFMWHSIQTGLLPTLMPAIDKFKIKPTS
jgi:hypothetical protein